MILFRKLMRDDVTSVMNLMRNYKLQYPKFIINSYPEKWNNYSNGSINSEFWVAVLGDEIVGHAGLIFNNEFESFEIAGVVVSPNFKRNGIGKELLHRIYKSNLLLDQESVILFTLGHPYNDETLKFYRSIGYKEVNYETDYFRPGYARVTFMKELNYI